MQLAIFEIPQVPGYRHTSRANKDVAESLATTPYAIPILIVNPLVAGGLAVDYVVRGRHRILPRHPRIIGPMSLSELSLVSWTETARSVDNPGSVTVHAYEDEPTATQPFTTTNSLPLDEKEKHE
jgi:hypothetical protein